MEWKAIYEDNTSLPQFNEDGTENKYTDIDRSKLAMFVLFRDHEPIVALHLDNNKKLICRRRVAVDNNTSKIKGFVWLVGWQERLGDRNSQVVVAVFEDNHIEIVDRFKEGHPWLYPIEFMPEERL